jgi:hypothetical protein
MAMSKEQHEQLIAQALDLESSGPIAPAPPGRAPPAASAHARDAAGATVR